MTEEIKNQRDEPDRIKREAFVTLVSIMHEKDLEIKKYMNQCRTLEMQLKEQQNVKRNNREGECQLKPSNKRDVFIFPNPPVTNKNRTYHHSKSLDVKGQTSSSSLRNNGDTLAVDNGTSVGASVCLDPANLPATGGVSSLIFNNVVNELVKTKLRLKDLQKERGVDDKSYVISKQTEAELRYLRSEHQRLRQENEDLKLKVETNNILINQLTYLQSSLSPKTFPRPRAVGISFRPQDNQQVSTQTDLEPVSMSQTVQTDRISIRNQSAQTEKNSSRDEAEDLHKSFGQHIEELKQELDKVRLEKETFERNYEQLMGSIAEMERNYEDKISSLQQTNQFLVRNLQNLKDEYSKVTENARILRNNLREEVQKNQHLQDALQQFDSGSDFDSFTNRLPFQSLYGRDSFSTQGSHHPRESPHHLEERNTAVTTPCYQPDRMKSPSQQKIEHPAQTFGLFEHASNHPHTEGDIGIQQTASKVSASREMSEHMAQAATKSTNREGYVIQPLPQNVTSAARGYYTSQSVSKVSAPSPSRGGYINQHVSQEGYAPSLQPEKQLGHQFVSPGGGDARSIGLGVYYSAQTGTVREPPVGDDISSETVYHTQHFCERCFGDFKTYDELLHHYQKCLD